MAKVHEIGVGADTRGFEDNVRSGIIKPTEQAADALDRLGDAAGDAGDQSAKAASSVNAFADKLVDASRKAGKSDDDIKAALRDMGLNAKQAEQAVERVGTEFKDTGRDGERAVDKLKDALKDAQRESEKLGRSGRDSGSDIGRGMRDAEDDVRRFSDRTAEVGDELRQNLGETFSSFRGDLEDLPQIAQDTLGGLAGSGALGGIAGLAATAAGAAGLGLIIGAMDAIGKEGEKLEGRAGSLAQAYIDAGTTVLDTVTLASRVSEVLTDPDQRADAQKLVDVLGVDLPEAARILAGDTNALAAAQEVLSDKNKALNDQRRDGKLLTEEEAAALADQQNALDNAGASLGTYASNNEKAAQIARDYSDALKGMISEAGDAGEEVDELGNKLITLPDNTQIFIDAKTGQATTDVSRFKGDTDGVIDHLNGREIVLRAEADTSGITRAVDRVIAQNGGKTIKIGTKIVTSGWDQ